VKCLRLALGRCLIEEIISPHRPQRSADRGE